MLDCLLRISLPDRLTPTVVGVDEFALRKGHRYATILIDATSGQGLDVLPDRKVGSDVQCHSACWAKAGPPIIEGKRAATTRERWQQVHTLLGQGAGLLECSRRLMGATELGNAQFRSPQQVSTIAAGTVRVQGSDRAPAAGREARPDPPLVA